jgi:hypothetical protein
VKASSHENGKKIGAVLKNISETVPEQDMLKIYQIISRKPDFFRTVVSKLDNPFVKKALKI